MQSRGRHGWQDIHEADQMIRAINAPLRAAMAIMLVTTIAGCVSQGGSAGSGRAQAGSTPPKPSPQFPPITIDVAEGATLGQTIRKIGETTRGGAVLVAGLEDWPAPAASLNASAFEAGIKLLTVDHGLKLQRLPDYVFIYPEGYEQLEGLALANSLDPRFTALNASFAVGAGTDLYNALALLGTSLNLTIVADNWIAGAWCGELFLNDAPLPVILEALLKSALVLPSALKTESTSEYIFIRSTQNQNLGNACLNAAQLNKNQRQALNRNVSMRLPRPASGVVFEQGSIPLAKALAEMSSQLDIPVTAEPIMLELPVNPAVMNNVSLETALNLIVWQWPQSGLGYRINDKGIVFGVQ